jgi:flagellar motor protein MotB
MTPVRTPRWALSFADLCLLLLAFFVLLQAQNGDRAKVAASMRSAFGDTPSHTSAHDYEARALFERGEAVLKPKEQARFLALGRRAAADHASIRIASDGMDPATRRFDAWELAAARVAAIARAVQAGGLPESRIEVVMPQMKGRATGQHISVATIH